MFLSAYLSIYPSIHIYIYLYLTLSLYFSLSLSTSLSLSLSPSIHRSMDPSISLSERVKQLCETSSKYRCSQLRNEKLFCENPSKNRRWYQKRSNSARLPPKLDFANIKNQAVLWDFHPIKQAELTASYQCTLCFFQSICLKYCSCHEKVKPTHTKCCACANQLSRPEDLMLQNATPLRKSAPWPPNISGAGDVSCTARATRNASLHNIFFKCPTPAIVFSNCYQTLTFGSLLARCRIHCACHEKRRLNVQKWSEHVVLLGMRLIRRPWKGCQFWDVPFTIPWKACKFQKWGLRKWGYRIWFSLSF